MFVFRFLVVKMVWYWYELKRQLGQRKRDRERKRGWIGGKRKQKLEKEERASLIIRTWIIYRMPPPAFIILCYYHARTEHVDKAKWNWKDICYTGYRGVSVWRFHAQLWGVGIHHALLRYYYVCRLYTFFYFEGHNLGSYP